MGIYDRIRMMREFHQWSQEDMASKMHMSLSGYAKIERGETKLHYDKLVQIAHIFQIGVVDLVDTEKGFALFMNEKTERDLASENEKLKLTLIFKDELLAHKEKELESLKKIIALLENREPASK